MALFSLVLQLAMLNIKQKFFIFVENILGEGDFYYTYVGNT